jgi:Cys-tRNA(Pro)/Cys-tRNA(Cys) deacylase
MLGVTPAVRALQIAGVPFTLHEYDHDGATRDYGREAATALGLDPDQVFKTLLVAGTDPARPVGGARAARALRMGQVGERRSEAETASSVGAADPARPVGGARDFVAVAIVPVSSKLSLKAAGAALGLKRVEMCDPAVAQRLTGYVLGGISPFGQRSQLPTVIDETCELFDVVYVSGGRRGLDVGVAPADLVALLGAVTADLTA